jgi:hypothetical protein
MSATLHVPAGFVPYLRSGLFGEWGTAASEIALLADDFGSNASAGAYSEPLQALLTIWLLKAALVGWRLCLH